jgi:hypothetical protein
MQAFSPLAPATRKRKMLFFFRGFFAHHLYILSFCCMLRNRKDDDDDLLFYVPLKNISLIWRVIKGIMYFLYTAKRSRPHTGTLHQV